ncbi:hypothetical protein HK104_002679 [Borealophlyctis nickersoniae]|nr:hypothetical protein HK104_002679 [Borealophlyctis nickersoniae]
MTTKRASFQIPDASMADDEDEIPLSALATKSTTATKVPDANDEDEDIPLSSLATAGKEKPPNISKDPDQTSLEHAVLRAGARAGHDEDEDVPFSQKVKQSSEASDEDVALADMAARFQRTSQVRGQSSGQGMEADETNDFRHSFYGGSAPGSQRPSIYGRSSFVRGSEENWRSSQYSARSVFEIPGMPDLSHGSEHTLADAVASAVIGRLHPWMSAITRSIQRIEADLDKLQRSTSGLSLRNAHSGDLVQKMADAVHQAAVANQIRVAHSSLMPPDPAAELAHKMSGLVQTVEMTNRAGVAKMQFLDAPERVKCDACQGVVLQDMHDIRFDVLTAMSWTLIFRRERVEA